jgi:hypothetical protein
VNVPTTKLRRWAVDIGQRQCPKCQNWHNQVVAPYPETRLAQRISRQTEELVAVSLQFLVFFWQLGDECVLKKSLFS